MPGLTLKEWGPGAWNTLHVFAHTAPMKPTKDEREQFRGFLTTFANYLPCPRCRTHFHGFLDRRMNEHTLATRGSIVRLLNDAHNEVNARCGKRVYSIDEHYAMYSLTARRGDATVVRNILLLAVVAVVVTRMTRRNDVRA